MTTTQPARAAELAARFAASKQAIAAGAVERRAIVLELLTFMSTREVAETLRISRARVGQIAAGHRTG